LAGQETRRLRCRLESPSIGGRISALRGFTLIEVLVTVVILAIGLLGMAGLLSAGIKNTQSALLLSQATTEAYNILDCIRANRAAAEAGAYNIALSGTPSGSSLAATDLTDWKNRLASVLPSGQGGVTCGAAACPVGSTYTVTVQWVDVLPDGSRGNVNIQIQSQPL